MRPECLRVTAEGIGRVADTAGVMGTFAAVTLVTWVMRILAAVILVVGLSALWIAARRTGTAQQSQPGRISSSMIRYLGILPANANRLERLRWVRNVGLKMTLPSLPFIILAVLVIDKTWFSTGVGVVALIWLGSMINLALDIRRERRSGAV